MATLTTSVTAASATSDAADAAVIQVADFEAIFLRYQGPITHFIAHTVGNREQAFDLAQDVFVKVYKALRDGQAIPQRALTSWLYRITINTIIDMLRKKRLITWLPLSLFNEESGIGIGVFSTSTGTTTAAFHIRDEGDERPREMTTIRRQQQDRLNARRFEERVADRQIIEQVFRQMPPKYSVCLWLFEHDGLSCLEVAERLRISVPATKMRLQRARQQFLTLYRREIAAC